MRRLYLRLISLLAELSRRRVGRVAAGYAVVGWLVIEFVTDVAPILPFVTIPSWLPTLVVAAVILGFPVAVGLAWIYDLTPEGIRRADRVRTDPGSPSVLQLAGAGGLMALSLFLVILSLGALWEQHGPAPEGSERVIAVFAPCSDENEPFAEDLALLLARAVDGLGPLQTIDPNQLLSAARHEELHCRDVTGARRVARRSGAGRFVLGHVLESDGGMRAELTMYDDGEPAYGLSEEASSVSDLRGLAASLAHELAEHELGGSDAEWVAVAPRMTRSNDALRLYLEGERLWRNSAWAASAESFERAVTADTAFALGWLRLGYAISQRGENVLGARAATLQAVRLSERLPERERQLLAAWDFQTQGRVREALEGLRVYLGRYPHDVRAWIHLGDLEFHNSHLLGRRPWRAVDAFQRALELDPRPEDKVYQHLIQALRDLGEHRRADSLHARWVPSSSSDIFDVLTSAQEAFASEDPRARQEAVGGLRQREDFVVRFVPMLLTPYEDVARQVLLDPLRSDPVRAFGHLAVGHERLARGRFRAALAAYDSVARIVPAQGLLYRALALTLPQSTAPVEELRAARSALLDWKPGPVAESSNPWFDTEALCQAQARAYLLGVLHALLDETGKALAYADTLDAMPSPEWAGALSPNLARAVRARVALAGEDERAALGELEAMQVHIVFPFQQTSPFTNHAPERYLRAHLLDRAGRSEEALEWFASLHPAGANPDYPFVGISHLDRARIHDRLEAADEAARHYGIFLEWWSEADPELAAWAEEARTALRRLGTSRVTPDRGS